MPVMHQNEPQPRRARLALTGGPRKTTRPSTFDFVVIAAPATCAAAVITLWTLGPLKLLPPALAQFLLTFSLFLVPVSILSIPVAGFRLATGKWSFSRQVLMTIVLLTGGLATIFLLYAYYAFARMWR